MTKETIKKVINTKYFNLILILIINLVFFIISNVLFQPKYEQVDDFIIMNLISKMDGIYNIYGIQIHPIICGIIILLFKTGISINWYTIFMLAMQFISFTIIGYVFNKENKIIGIPLYIVFIFIMYSKMLRYIQYTTVAILCMTAGFILLMSSIRNDRKTSIIFALVMIGIGTMIRFSAIIIVIPFISLYFFCEILKQKRIKILKLVLILILLIFGIYISFQIIYNINPTYRKFLDFHDVRTYLHDYNWMTYKNNEEVFNRVNWTQNDRDMLYAYCFGDEEYYNIESLEKLREEAQKNNNNVNIIQKINFVVDEFVKSVKSDTYKYIFFISVILVIFNNLFIIFNKDYKNLDKKAASIKVSFVNLIFILMVAMHSLFIYLNRPMFRVVISIYIIGTAILMYELITIQKIKLNKEMILKGIFIIIILYISILELRENIFYAQYYDKEDYSVYKEIVDFTSSHKENAYLYTLVMHDRFLAYSIYEKIPDDSYINIRPLGDWDTYTGNYYFFKEKYNLENLITDLYNKDNVYLISGNVIWGERYGQYINIIEKYIKEHFNTDIKLKTIKEFDKDIKIYKIEKK